jgi:death-on-curing protein
MPQATFGGQHLHKDLLEMAAAYLFHVVQDHAFVDGNKRTGAVAAVVFLAMNGIDLEADQVGFEALVLDVAQGKADKARIAEYFRRHGL